MSQPRWNANTAMARNLKRRIDVGEFKGQKAAEILSCNPDLQKFKAESVKAFIEKCFDERNNLSKFFFVCWLIVFF